MTTNEATKANNETRATNDALRDLAKLGRRWQQRNDAVANAWATADALGKLNQYVIDGGKDADAFVGTLQAEGALTAAQAISVLETYYGS